MVYIYLMLCIVVPVQETCSPEQMAQQIGFPADTINKAAKNCGMSYIV